MKRKLVSMNRQAGQAIVYILLIAFVAAAGGGVIYTYSSAITRAERAEADLQAAQQANQEQQNELDKVKADKAKLDSVLAAKQGREAAIATLERKIDANLKAALKNPESRRWYDTPVPADILAGVRQPGLKLGTDSSKDGARPGATVAPDARAGIRLPGQPDKR